MDLEALRKKAELNLLKKQQVCTDSILKDINFTVSMPLESAHVAKANHAIFDNKYVEEKDAIKKDVRAP